MCFRELWVVLAHDKAHGLRNQWIPLRVEWKALDAEVGRRCRGAEFHCDGGGAGFLAGARDSVNLTDFQCTRGRIVCLSCTYVKYS